ncbi:uncharacterized protein LOC132284564 isoform X2 [Cornus florida]|uniref:uncharacterized protein LOC132284564 isoform X2 n=1 Tax=Cornus florida TaxID=4283 RepID=UPI00289E0D2E|nr:uncharacterized protein LOC132284564 isoform X2 [Cornus florida]
MEVTYNEHSIEEEEHTLLQLEKELQDVESSIIILNANLEELALEKQESDFQSHCDANRSKLQAEISELEELISNENDDKTLSNGFCHSLHDSLERLNSAKRELATKLRAIVLLKRKLDEVPSQAELIQYERGFSDLNSNIQGKLQQTRKYYATFNALLEIKDLMLKETSLLNSISSQFQNAITSTAGRTKLTDSMDGIVKGTQQKLEKVQLMLEKEQKVCDAVKEKYATAIAKQRHSYSLLQDFHEECAKNERLRNQTSESSH